MMQRSSTTFGLQADALELIYSSHAHLQTTSKVVSFAALSKDQIAELFATAFWASLRTNEGRPTRVRLGVPADATGSSLPLVHPLPLDEKNIVALAPAVPSEGWIAIAASNDGVLSIVGLVTEHPIPILSGVTTFDIVGQGIVRMAFGEFQPFAVLSGRSLAITATADGLSGYLAKVLQTAFPEEHYALQVAFQQHVALIDLALRIVDEGHGGALLVVPHDDMSWEQSLSPYAYKLQTPNTSVTREIQASVDTMRDVGVSLQTLYDLELPEDAKKKLRDGIQTTIPGMASIPRIAKLAQVDGAVVATPDVRILGFGAKIRVSETPALVELKPGTGGEVEPIDLEKLGGTRHQSAARFVGANKRVVAIVASSDRRLSILSWNAERKAVVVFRNAEWWS